MLAHDLSNLLNSNLNELIAVAEPSNSRSPLLEHTTPNNLFTTEDFSVQSNIPCSSLKLTGVDQFYLQEFYDGFSDVILTFQAEVNGTMTNPVRDILMVYAGNSHYLLYALLACGARSSYRKSHLPDDQSSYKLYLTRSLATLTKAMEKDMMANIDSILLTIMVLTCDSASHTRQQWRPHLQGASQLLLNVEIKRPCSMIFLLCKLWYSSIEILAGLVSPNGGILKSNEELDQMIVFDRSEQLDKLQKLHVVTNEGFSLFHGYSIEMLAILKELIKLIKEGGKKTTDFYTIIDLISSARKELDFQAVDKSGIIDESHPYFRKIVNEAHTGLSSNVGLASLNGRKVVLSWLDISNHCYALAALITICTKVLKMEKENEMIQYFVKELISKVCYFDDTDSFLKSNCFFVLQWPMLVAGANTVLEEHRLKVETFFRVVAQLGSGSAGFSLARLQRIWSEGETAERESRNRVDMVTY